MRPFWRFQLFLATAGAVILAGNGCGRSGNAVHHDGATTPDVPMMIGGISGSSGGVGGSPAGTGGKTSAGDGGETTPDTGGSAIGGSTGSGGTSTNGGATGGAGSTGSSDDGGVRLDSDGGDGAVDEANNDGGPATDTYSACIAIADPSDFVVIIKTTAQGMCVRLTLQTFYPTGTLGLTLPTGWTVWSTARWPSSAAPCTTAGTPKEASQASSGTGTVTFGSGDLSPGLIVDVNVVLTYPQGDSGASESENLQTSVAAAGSCPFPRSPT